MTIGANTQSDKAHQASESIRYYMPLHNYDIPYWAKACLCLVLSALSILIGLVFPEFVIVLFCWAISTVAIGILIGWAAWSCLSRNKYVYTDPDTGRKYAVRTHGNQIIDCYQCAKDWVDVENKVLGHINDTSIPDMIPQNARLTIDCHCFTPETIKLYVEYLQECDLHSHLDGAIHAAYPGSDVFSSDTPLGNGYVLVDYTIRRHHDAESFSS